MLKKKLAARRPELRAPATDRSAGMPSREPTPGLLPLGAMAAGFGLLGASAFAQTAPPVPAASASAPVAGTTLKAIAVKAKIETDADSVRATTTTIGKGTQELRDVPQSVTVVTEKLMEDRRIDTLKQALHQTAGISFLAAEGGEEDIRLRGFSLAASGDIYVDSLRDPAFYERDTFSYDRVELLRGSASMLFGRGSTGGVVNQVNKLPFLSNASEINATLGTGSFLRFTGDFNLKLSDTSAVRVNVMETDASGHGGNDKLDKQGLAPTIRWGINTDDEFYAAGYYLHNNNGINYGLPWVRQNASAATPATINKNLDPNAYYGAPTDYNAGEAAHLTGGWTHRFGDGGQLKTAIRHGRYDRDLRGSTIRFCQRTVNAAGAIVNADCPTTLPGLDTITDAQPLVRGTNNKVQNMTTTYAQSDYTNSYTWFGRKNDITTGIDLAHEVFHNFGMVVPPGVTLDKNVLPRETVGSPNNGLGGVDESLRSKRLAAQFDAKSLGLYVQDLVEIVPTVKLLAGLRWDDFKGSYQTFQANAPTAAQPAAVGTQLSDRSRSDKLWSKRFGLLWQPTDAISAYASYGTSFNTSGDTYQYDDLSKNTPPEGSINYEVGVKADLLDGKVSGRLAVFKSVKTNERDRDSDTASPASYLLSGRRHAAGVELDLAGRITSAWEVYGSYAWIPSAKIDQGNADGTTGTQPGGTGELVGQRPSLTPRHSGTIWTTYQILPALRIGGGLNARSAETPNRNPVGVIGPHYVTGDLLAEFTASDSVAFKLNVLNVTDKLYSDSLYTGHYVPGLGRQVQLTMTARF